MPRESAWARRDTESAFELLDTLLAIGQPPPPERPPAPAEFNGNGNGHRNGEWERQATDAGSDQPRCAIASGTPS